MKIIEQVPEIVMIAAFLKAEFKSERFAGELKDAMAKLGAGTKVVTDPDLEDADENELRARILGEYRGYKQNWAIFAGFPDDLKWYRAEIGHEELGDLRYVDYSYWNELSDNTHLVRVAAENIRAGKVVFDVSNERFHAVADIVRRGEHDFEPIILWGDSLEGPLTILEGHLRVTALALAGDEAPEVVEALVGVK